MSCRFNPGSDVAVTTLFKLRNSSKLLVLAAMLLLFCSRPAWAQATGPVDPGKELSQGSYSQSGFEDLNLYNGHMSINSKKDNGTSLVFRIPISY